jgi:hypothetical protein
MSRSVEKEQEDTMKRFTFILAFALTGFLFTGFFSTVEAGPKRHHYIKVAPPAARVVVVRPACPHKNGVWVEGYWAWKHNRHVWVDGRWVKPKHGRVWVDGHWVNTPHGWEWIKGHWRKI